MGGAFRLPTLSAKCAERMGHSAQFTSPMLYHCIMENLWNFLKGDSGRPVLTIATIVISVAVAITLFLLNRKRKSLIYEILSMTRLLSVREEMANRVRVLVDDVPVRDVGLVQIKITNSGTELIRASDFVRPISFVVENGVRIIEAEVSDKRPGTIDAEIQKEDQRVTLLPTLFNSKDSLVLKLLIANFDGVISADARIEGVELKPRPNLRNSKWAPSIVLATKFLSPVLGVGAELVLPEEIHNDYKRPN